MTETHDVLIDAARGERVDPQQERTNDGVLLRRDAADVETVLVRNVYGAATSHAATLAIYLLDEAARLAAEPVAAITHAQGAAA